MSARLRIVVADDERPARSFLVALLHSFDDVAVVGEADSGKAAIVLIERERPDLALLDVQMPELDGLSVVRALNPDALPLVAFVTAYDEYAICAFEMNAVDYLLKPVERVRLRETINRAHGRVEIADDEARRVEAAIEMSQAAARAPFLERIPVRRHGDVLIVSVNQVASIVAEAELLHLTTVSNERHTITYRLKDLEARLDPARFLRLGRGTLANLDFLVKINILPGRTYVAVLSNGQELPVSRLQARLLREQFLRL